MQTIATSKKSLCVISPVFNEEEVLPLFIRELEEVKQGIDLDVKLLLVDDGSRDSTWQLISEAAAKHSWVGGVKLSRNFGHQAALSCGYRLAKGDVVVSMDADLQDPPNLILEMVAKWREGYDVVTAVRSCRKTDSFFKRLTAEGFYWLIEKIGNVQAPRNAGDFRLLSRPALDALNSMNEGSLYLRGLVGWIGFPATSVFYKRPERQAGTTKFPLMKMLRFASDSIASFSTAPLKMSYALAISLFLVLMTYGVYSAIAVLFLGHKMEAGWLSLIASVTIIGCANLLCLGVIGEYVGRIYMEGKKRPIFLVAETKNME
jgi:glycosyltransferase involved in cell wall biosynthesis